MQRSSVLLPEPLLPMMATTSPRRDVEVDALQHLVVPKRLRTSVIANERH